MTYLFILCLITQITQKTSQCVEGKNEGEFLLSEQSTIKYENWVEKKFGKYCEGGVEKDKDRIEKTREMV